MRVCLDIKSENLKFFNVKSEPFEIYGLYKEQEGFDRIPQEIADRVSGAVANKNHEPTGGRIRFATNSDIIAIRVRKKAIGANPIIPPIALMGFDIYEEKDGKQKFLNSFLPPVDGNEYYEGEFKVCGGKMKEYILNMPLFNQVVELEIGISDNAEIVKPSGYKYDKPIVFYGSSITQGVGASRPGNAYEGFVSRILNADYINLGFSGNAKGEQAMADYIADLDMLAFVLDYDHNAPDSKHLEDTHYNFYKIVRDKNPILPIILISKPDDALETDNILRKDIIINTYLKARASGDKNIYFIDGYSFFSDADRSDCTIDGCHPNDIGYYFMGYKIADMLNNIL